MKSELLPDIDALLVSNQTNVRYLSGFIPVEAGHREAQLLIGKNKTYLFTNPLYAEKAKELTADKQDWTVKIMGPGKPLSVLLSEIVEAEQIKKIGFEDQEITVAEYNRLVSKLPSVQWSPALPQIERMRMIKRDDEVAHIRKACILTDECYAAICELLRPGVSETYIAWQIEKYFKERNAELAFAPIVAFGKNASQPHYAPRRNCTLQEDSAVLMDFGARINGYCADMTRVVFVGTPSETVMSAYEATLAGQEKALQLLANGERSGAVLDKAAKAEITARGFPVYPHSLGHNVGLDIHEGPRLSEMYDETVETGMIFSVEPGIYVEGEYGIRIEDLVRLTSAGVEILSQAPKIPTKL